jgi:hypothetical protein
MHTLGRAVDNCFDTLHVGLPSPVGAAVGVGYFDAESDFFAAIITFCHGGTSFADGRSGLDTRLTEELYHNSSAIASFFFVCGADFLQSAAQRPENMLDFWKMLWYDWD